MLETLLMVILVVQVVVHLIDLDHLVVVRAIHQQIQIIHKFKDIKVEILPRMYHLTAVVVAVVLVVKVPQIIHLVLFLVLVEYLKVDMVFKH